jgi:hypothetical protein
MNFYIFTVDTGNYQGIRGVYPTEPDLIGIETTEANVEKMTNFVKPMLSKGEIIESATPEEIEEVMRPSVPLEVALWKLKFILSQMGLEQSVLDSINQLPDPPKTAALYLWNYGTAVDRHSATVDLIKKSVGLNDRQVDDIFIQANSITL